MRMRTCTMDQMQRHLDSMEAPEYYNSSMWDDEEDQEEVDDREPGFDGILGEG